MGCHTFPEPDHFNCKQSSSCLDSTWNFKDNDNNQQLPGSNWQRFYSKECIAHCVSADFKTSAGIVRHFKGKLPTRYPCHPDHTYTPTWPQWLPEAQRFFHSVTKQRYNNKPTYCILRTSIIKLQKHAQNNGFLRNICILTKLDQLGSDEVKMHTQETFWTSSVPIVVYLLPAQETEKHEKNRWKWTTQCVSLGKKKQMSRSNMFVVG